MRKKLFVYGFCTEEWSVVGKDTGNIGFIQSYEIDLLQVCTLLCIQVSDIMNPKFFNYFRMSIKSFDNLLELIKEEIKAIATAILCISRRALTRVDKVPGVRLGPHERTKYARCNAHTLWRTLLTTPHSCRMRCVVFCLQCSQKKA
jgi:hypothetical protein